MKNNQNSVSNPIVLSIEFLLNNQTTTMEVTPELTVLEMLQSLGMMGTKEGCGEGDCGACTVALGNMENGKIKYRSVVSCVMPAAQLHKKHLITIEGLSDRKEIHPVQQAIIDAHGTQCGFCTPGVVMSIFTLLVNEENPSDDTIADYLTGNLCRCTGYDSILHAAKLAIKKRDKNFIPKFVVESENKINDIFADYPEVSISGNDTASYHIPTTLEQLFKVLETTTDNRTIVSGGTDLLVAIKKADVHYKHYVDITYLKEVKGIKIENNELIIGSAVLLTDIEENEFVKEHVPALIDSLSIMASRQIRSMATLGGNIANASPVADTVPPLMAGDGQVILLSAEGTRKIALKDFYKGYKSKDMKKNEIILGVAMPLKGKNHYSSFLKFSKRKHLDIATANSTIYLVTDDNKDKIISANLVIGGCGPTTIKAVKTEVFLTGKSISEDTAIEAGKIASAEVSPMSDVRGSKEYRLALVEAMLLKHFLKLFPEKFCMTESGKEV